MGEKACRVKEFISLGGCVLQVDGEKDIVSPQAPFVGHGAFFCVHKCVFVKSKDGQSQYPTVIKWDIDAGDGRTLPLKKMTRFEAVQTLRNSCRFLLKDKQLAYVLEDGLRLMPRDIRFREDIETVYNDTLRAMLRALVSHCFAAKPPPIISYSVDESLRHMVATAEPMERRLTLCAREQDVADAERVYCQRAEVFSADETYEKWRVILLLGAEKIAHLSPLQAAETVRCTKIIIQMKEQAAE